MKQVNIHEAKTHFSELIAAVERGEEIMIARRGKVVAKLGAPAAGAEEQPKAKAKRVLGKWAGRIKVDPSFYEPMSEEELSEWERPPEALADVARVQAERRAG